MRLVLKRLDLHFRHSKEVIELNAVRYFWGKIGAGKSSIARLIDYCLGANIALTPALQLEFVSATLDLEVGNTPLSIFRQRESAKVIASWKENDQTMELELPARVADGIVIPDTQVEVLSDLLFYLAGMDIPLVRKGKSSGSASHLVRLSFRDLFRFCYLDQDEMDSDFFRLDLEGDWARRQKSIDAMRFVLGYHQDRVATLEVELQKAREQRLALVAGAEALRKALEQEGFADPAEIDVTLKKLTAELEQTKDRVAMMRSQGSPKDHAVDLLRDRGRTLAGEIQSLQEALDTVIFNLAETERHRNELKMLSIRFHRTSSAKAVLASVQFIACPRCAQELPKRAELCCPVCGQGDVPSDHKAHFQEDVIKQDVKARLNELQDAFSRLRSQRDRLARAVDALKIEKMSVDNQLNGELRQYDSAFLSQALQMEREAATLEQKISSLTQYRKLPEKLATDFSAADILLAKEKEIKSMLDKEREAAFKDRSNLELLERLFLDCLVRSAFPGINQSFQIRIDPKNFLPELFPLKDADFAVTSFANMGSGGMKGIFKACYALALHRLAAKSGAALPSIAILDSVMKNVSERENKDVFEGFFRLVYELAASELSGTQVIIVDKEFFPVPEDIELTVKQRHMMPGSKESPPLIPYYEIPPQ